MSGPQQGDGVSEEDIFREAGVDIGQPVDEEAIFQGLEAAQDDEPSPPVAQPVPAPEPVAPPAPLPAKREPVDPGAFASGMRGVADYGAAGFADEGVGALESMWPRLALPAEDFFNPNVPTPPARTYREARDAQRVIQKDARETNPAAYHGAGLMTGLVPVGSIGSGVRGAMQTGALWGAVSGLGNSTEELTGPDADKAGAALDVGAGATVGAVAGRYGYKAAEGLGNLASTQVPRFVKWLRDDFAPTQAMRAMGGTGSDFTYLTADEGADKVRQFGRTLLDEGVVPAVASSETRFNQVQPALRAAGADMGAELRGADATQIPFDLERYLQRVEEELIAPNAKSPGIAAEIAAIQSKVDEFRKMYPEGVTDFVNANRLKSDLGNAENWGNHWNAVGPSKFLKQFARQMVGIFGDEVDQQVGGVAGRASRESFEAAKERYAALKWAERISGRAIGKEVGNGPVSMKDLQAGQVAASVMNGNPTLGGLAAAGAVAGYNFVRKHSGGLLANGAERVSQSDFLYNLARTNPQVLGDYGGILAEAALKGPEAVAIQDWLLAQSSPDYAERRRAAMGAEPQSQQ